VCVCVRAVSGGLSVWGEEGEDSDHREPGEASERGELQPENRTRSFRRMTGMMWPRFARST
jgi:hypothetical protein